MIVLFSPSQDKLQPLNSQPLDLASFYFKKDKRLLKAYDDFLKNASIEERQALFGSKKTQEIDIFSSPTLAATKLYSGVAYKELDFNSLDIKAKEFCKKNVIIFSTLFGPVFGGEKLPFYKLKQGKSFSFYKIPTLYKDLNKNELDEFLKDEEIIDLRASYYEGFYPALKNSVKIIFKKNGKVLSHNAKKYRGKLLRLLAIKPDLDQALKDLRPASFEKKENSYILDFI